MELSEQIFVPTQIGYNGKPEKFISKNKTKEMTIFDSLLFYENRDEKYYNVINDMFVFIDLIEVLKAFTGKKLQQEKEYSFSDKFTAKITQKDKNIYLKIHFKNYSNFLFLDKFECSSLAAKFSKILQKCEPWQELDQ